MRYVCPPAKCRPAQGDGVLVEALSHRGQGEVVDAGTPGTHPNNGDVIRITPVTLDIILDPSANPNLKKIINTGPKLVTGWGGIGLGWAREY